MAANRGGYIVLELCHSQSSKAVYEVRRGGDGVLYCLCPGWRNCKAAPGAPKVCKHTKAYAARTPGTTYGPPGRFAVESVKVSKAATVPRYTGPEWLAMVREERKTVRAKGVPTPPEAASAYALDLDLD